MPVGMFCSEKSRITPHGLRNLPLSQCLVISWDIILGGINSQLKILVIEELKEYNNMRIDIFTDYDYVIRLKRSFVYNISFKGKPVVVQPEKNRDNGICCQCPNATRYMV